jgi:hypothetical protein
VFILFFHFITVVTAAETEYTLEPIVVKASSSFDSLSEDPYLPQKKIKFNHTRAGTLDSLDKYEPFPSTNEGYPSGAKGTALGGRSMDDVQVSTLGVPLNLPQGGGPDLSFFPSFLWSGLNISSVPSMAGFSPQGVSGSMQFDLWTRTQVRDYKFSSAFSRVTAHTDRQIQNFSIATKKDNIAIQGGMNFGMQTGPAGSLSYYFIRKPKSHFLFHIIGTDQDGESHGSKNSPTPWMRKKSWRVIPVLESHQELGDESDPIIWESTYYADLHQMKFAPAAFPSSDRTQQYGIENALHWGPSTLAFTARLVNYQSSTFGSVSEWPVLGQYSYEFSESEEWKIRLSGGGNWVSSVGFAPTARLSFKNTPSDTLNWFYEVNSLAKMPTLTSRYYFIPSVYSGNPNLKVERVSALIAGFQTKGESLDSSTTLKAEYRNQIQVGTATSMINDGNASLFSWREDLTWRATAKYHNDFGILLTYSKIANSGLPYPNLPYFSILWGASYTFNDQFKINRTMRYVGHSTQSGGGQHDHYLLMDMSLDYSPTEGTTITIGCDNLTDQHAEVVANYPLPGQIVYLNLVSNF